MILLFQTESEENLASLTAGLFVFIRFEPPVDILAVS